MTGAAGYVSQPVLSATIRPQIGVSRVFQGLQSGGGLLPGAALVLSWQTVIVGDPSCAPFRGATQSRADLEKGIDDVTELPGLFSARRLDVAMEVAPGIPEEALALTLRAESLSARGDAAGSRKAVEEALKLAPRSVATLVMGAALDERPAAATTRFDVDTQNSRD